MLLWFARGWQESFAAEPNSAYQAITRLAPAGDYREKQGRSTGRYLVDIDGQKQSVYLKKYFRLPWHQRWLAPLASFPGPAERSRLQIAAQLGVVVPEAVAAGADRSHACRSFLAIRELTGFVALHRYFRECGIRLPLAHKRALGRRIAQIARRLHQAHWFHRDFYLCHLFIRPGGAGPDDFELAMIDFGRLLNSRRRRWQVKDLAQLLFSSDEPGITRTDRLRCFKQYLQLKKLDAPARKLAREVMRKADRYRRHNKA